MKVVYTAEALHDLDEILAFIRSNYPAVVSSFITRLRSIEQRVGEWSESAEEVAQRPGVRVVPFIRYPFKLFYRVGDEAVEVLHIHHTARLDPWTGER